MAQCDQPTPPYLMKVLKHEWGKRRSFHTKPVKIQTGLTLFVKKYNGCDVQCKTGGYFRERVFGDLRMTKFLT